MITFVFTINFNKKWSIIGIPLHHLKLQIEAESSVIYGFNFPTTPRLLSSTSKPLLEIELPVSFATYLMEDKSLPCTASAFFCIHLQTN
jgi:hypothetical protein